MLTLGGLTEFTVRNILRHTIIGYPVSVVTCRHSHGKAWRLLRLENDPEFQDDCKTLELPYNCDEAQVRSAFIRLAKKFHPDGGTADANRNKFNEVDTAYKNILKRFAEERHNAQEIESEHGLYHDALKKERTGAFDPAEDEKDDIEHVTPQHRQYLSYDGVGFGSPAQRQKHYQKHKAMKAASNVWDHRVQQALRGSMSEETALVAKTQRSSRDIKTRYGMDRLVEDLIQESMARGDFKNLKGQGKPLTQDRGHNPYIDFTTHKLNEVLIDNGFTPEWIVLEKEVRQEIRDLRKKMAQRRHEFDEQLAEAEEIKWEDYVSSLVPEVDVLNAKIQKYNLVVPSIFKQIICIRLENEAKKVRQTFSPELREQVLSMRAKCQANLESLASVKNARQPTLVDVILSVIKN